MGDAPDDLRARTLRLFEYLHAVRAMREQPVRNVVDYAQPSWWERQIPDHVATRTSLTGEGAWLEVAKADVPPRPSVPENVADILEDTLADPDREPALIADVEGHFGDDVAGYVEAIDAFERYLEHQWRPWAAAAQPALAARKLYEDLYDLRLRLQREEALIELVWGHGILTWQVNGEQVMHPMVTTRMQVSFNPDTGQLDVVPEALIPQLEIDVLQGLGLKGFDLLVDLRERFRAEPTWPFDPEIRNVYQQILAPLAIDGRLIDGDDARLADATPTISASWCLLVRRRSTMYQRFFQSLRDGLADGTIEVPAPIGAVVADEPSRLDGDGVAEEWRAVGEELLMPLPTNEEQEQIAIRLARHRGVTVQGPPGTGKTHTIANLVSHLVAHGLRVLVTSHKEQPLAVLRDKIPESIRDLCVSVLGSSATSLAQLDQSVQAIYGESVALDRASARRHIESLRAELDGARREIALLRDRIRRSVEQERALFPGSRVEQTPSALARWLSDAAARLGFIPDSLALEVEVPLSQTEIVRLYQLVRDIEPADQVQAVSALPDADKLPSGAALSAVAAELAETRDRLADSEDTVENWVAIEALGREPLDDLIQAVQRGADRLERLESPWLLSIRDEISRNAAFATTWRDHAKAWRGGIDEVATNRGIVAGHRVVLPESGLPSKETVEALEVLRTRFASGKGVGRVLHRELRQLRDGCRVDEEAPRSAEDIELCLTEARLRRRRYELVNRWNAEVTRAGGEAIDASAPSPEFALDVGVRSVEDALAWEDGEWGGLRERLVEAGVRAPTRPSSAQLHQLTKALRTASSRFMERDLANRLKDLRDRLTADVDGDEDGVLWDKLVQALDGYRWTDWDEARSEALRLRSLAPRVRELDALLARLAQVAPVWTAGIVASRGDEMACGPALLVADAWLWRQAETWLHTIISGDDPAELQHKLEAGLAGEARLTTELASASAWLGLAEKLTDEERQALTAWAQALKKVGKGTGKYASKWRTVAQGAMRQAQSAVPVWIMPTYRVVESFDPSTTLFDVVIVDESSQCDVFALAALALARKAVVVGDDKQISPQAVGVDQGTVHSLISQHLSGVPHAELLDVTSSLYDTAKRTFPGVIMLKEHFRCLPEIIEFSNQLAYNGQILPLREEADDPEWRPVCDVLIPDGYREKGTDTNLPEADFIVDKIVSLCADERYREKTFGVISLLGDGQAALIEGRLVGELGEREIERRRIRCGNAYHFQGDERDVMFLSLVVAGPGIIGAMTREADRQRMNVAASRARDQMWCVRSVEADELHSDDVRSRFIRYCQDPHRVQQEFGELADRCDSDFERDVLREVLSRGFKVLVQHRVGKLRIDLVVQGRPGRLAIECDGDAYHGPERWDADRSRQAILERLGWTFFRVRGSAFYRNRDDALSALWGRLDDLGIRPWASVEDRPPLESLASLPTIAAPAATELERDRATEETRSGTPEVAQGRQHVTLDDDAVTAMSEIEPFASPPTGVFAGHVSRADLGTIQPSGGFPDSPALAPYAAWVPHPLPDALQASRARVADGLVEIVTAEGPIVARRAYELYVRSGGGQRVGRSLRHNLNRAAAQAVRDGRLSEVADDTVGQADRTLCVAGADSVVVRVRGERDLEDIPVTEVAALGVQLLASHPGWTDELLKRRLLELYERIRLTTTASAFLDRCVALARA